MEDYMVPKFVEFRDELPKTSSGKIFKRALTGSETDSVAAGAGGAH
jgi:acyl-coenzyme A synthetase/AMP-(fatty) acid ligase